MQVAVKYAEAGRPALLRIDEVQHELGCGRSTVYELMADGRLRSVKVGRNRRIPASEVDRFIAGLMAGSE